MRTLFNNERDTLSGVDGKGKFAQDIRRGCIAKGAMLKVYVSAQVVDVNGIRLTLEPRFNIQNLGDTLGADTFLC
jgi:hypothetical protein